MEARSLEQGRTTLDPRVGPAVTAILARANAGQGLLSGMPSDTRDWPDVGSILETHDPRWVSNLVDQIRRSTEEGWPKWSPGNRADAAARLVRSALKLDADAAYPLMTVWSGYAREAAILGIDGIPGPFCLAMLVHRTNDWVETVRTAAEAKLTSLKGSLKPHTIVGCVEFLWEFHRFGRARHSARRLVVELLGTPGVLIELESEALRGATDRSLRIFRNLLRGTSLDDKLASIATTSPHPRIRATATRALLSGTFQWAGDDAPQGRTLNVELDRETFARVQLDDRSPAVQLAALEYIATHCTGWVDYQELLLRFADNRLSALAEIARWGLNQAGFDWVEPLRAIFKQQVKPSPRLAAILGKFGTPEDGLALYALASTMTDNAALPYLAAAAEQKVSAAVERLAAIAIRDADVAHARRSSRILFRLGVILDTHDLQVIAARGDEFFERGLGWHFGKVGVTAQLNILARLEAAKADFNVREWFATPLAKINRGAFVVSDTELDELNVLFQRAPKVRAFARTFLGLGKR